MSRRSWTLFLAALALSVLAEFVLPIDHHGKEFFWLHIPVFWALYGFFGCVLIVVASKWLGRTMLDRPDDYYEPQDHPVAGENLAEENLSAEDDLE